MPRPIRKHPLDEPIVEQDIDVTNTTLVDRLAAMKVEKIREHTKLMSEIDRRINLLQQTDAESIVQEAWKFLGTED